VTGAAPVADARPDGHGSRAGRHSVRRKTSTRKGAWRGLRVGALDREETERQIADLMSGQG
jgi:hypothetical protein